MLNRTNKPSKSKNRCKGFTLIELLISIAIVAIISAIAIPSYMSSVEKTRRNDAKETLLRLAVAQENFYSQNGNYTTVINTAAGLNNGSNFSSDGFYTISSIGSSSFTITATAVSGKAQFDDTSCRKFIITSDNTRSAENSAAGAATDCW